MQGNVTRDAARSWFAQFVERPQADTGPLTHVPKPGIPALDTGAAQTAEQRATADGLAELERLKGSITNSKGQK